MLRVRYTSKHYNEQYIKNTSLSNLIIEKYPLEGLRTYTLRVLPDERGFFAEVLRSDWNEFLGDEWIAQVSLSMSFPGITRAWHRHTRGQIDYFFVIQGAMKIVCYDGKTDSPTFGHLVEIIVNDKRLQIVRVPGHYWHGIKAIGNIPSLLVYFVTRLYDNKNPDEERKPWDDPSIIPKVINGKTNDPRIGKPWKWDYPPHR
jgi:dTDP-4-dehydrorhamnose 3,5-epimerase